MVILPEELLCFSQAAVQPFASPRRERVTAGCCPRIQARKWKLSCKYWTSLEQALMKITTFLLSLKLFFLFSSCTYLFRYRHTLSLGSIAIMCGFCKPPQSLEATKGCADCKSNFCNECFKLYHPWGTPRAQHEHIPPTNHFRPKVCLQLSPTLSAVTTTAPQSSSCFRF